MPDYDAAIAARNQTAPNASVVNNQYSAIYANTETGDTLEKIGGSASWRYNNPGNMQYTTEAGAMAATGAVGSAAVNDGGSTYYRAIFATMEAGFAALSTLLAGKYVGMTVADALNAYAPPATNNTQSYIDDVTSRMNVPPTTVLTNANIGDFASGIVAHEGTQEGLVYTNNLPGDPNAVYDKWDALARKPVTVSDLGTDLQFQWLDGGVNVYGMVTVTFSKDAIGTIGGDNADVPPANLSRQRYPEAT